MKIEKFQFGNVRYNAERGAFEALVRIHDQGRAYSYPAELPASLHAEFSLIARGLAQAASRAHKHAEGGARLTHPTPVKPAAVDASQTSLLSRLLGNAAA